MPETLELTEWQRSEPVDLTVAERDALSCALPKAEITAVAGSTDRYTINPKGVVGLLRVGDRVVHIRPKLPVERVQFLLAYAIDPKHWRDSTVFATDADVLHEAIAIPFIAHANRAIRRNVLSGYRNRDDTLHGLRGKLRLNDQIRKRQRMSVPLELAYDEFTTDIDENRLLLAAAHRLLRLRRLPEIHQSTLRQITATLCETALVDYHPQRLPPITFTRLNAHYEPALRLAQLVLRSRSLELGTGTSSTDSLLFDMAHIFEAFVHTALREALAISERSFPRAGNHPRLSLDTDQRLNLKPDLSWWQNNRCRLVGDVKYKQTLTGDGRHPDIYQALAYAHATQLGSATLIYAASETEPRVHTTINDVTVYVEALNLNGRPDEILAEVAQLAYELQSRAAATAPSLAPVRA